jgi:hypothetical protein
MTLFSRISTGLGAFLLVAGIIYGLVVGQLGPPEWEGLTLMLTVAGGALLVGTYFVRAVQRARARIAAQSAGETAGDSEPHVAPTIWPLIFALSMIGLVFGVETPWALAGGGVLLVVSLVGWSLDVRRQWRHHDHHAADTAHGTEHAGAGQ